MLKLAYLGRSLPVFLPLILSTSLFSQSPKQPIRSKGNPHKFITNVTFQNGDRGKFHLLKVYEDSLEVTSMQLDIKLDAPFTRTSYDLPQPKIFYGDINRITIGRRKGFEKGFLIGLGIGAAIGIPLFLPIGLADEASGFGDALAAAALGTVIVGLPFGTVGGLIGVFSKDRHIINGQKENFKQAKPLLKAYEHFK